MSFISFSTDPNTMNSKQLDQFKLNYAELIVDGMDMDTIVTIGAAANGCNTIEYNTFTLDWLGNATSSDSTVTSCGSFTWGDSTWTATGTYPYPAGSNAVGCDSTVNVILTIEEFANGGGGVADSSAANGNNITINAAFVAPLGWINWNTCGPVTVASGAVVDSTALANFAASTSFFAIAKLPL